MALARAGPPTALASHTTPPDSAGTTQVWVWVPGGTPSRLTASVYGVTPTPLAWTPDGLGVTVVEGLDPWQQLTATHEGNYEQAPGVDDPPTAVEVGAPATFGLQELVRVAGGERQVLVSAAFGEQLSAPQWSPDGTQLAFEHFVFPFFGRKGGGKICVWQNGELSDAFPSDVSEHTDSLRQQRGPVWSPDGTQLAFVGPEGLALGVPGSPPRHVLQTAIPWGQPPVRMSDGQRVLVNVQQGLRIIPVLVDVQSCRMEELLKDPMSCRGFALAPDGQRLALVLTHADRLAELVIHQADSRLTPVTTANDALAAFPLARTRVVRWSASDGPTIEGMLTVPPGDPPGKGWPLFLFLHGGPQLGLHLHLSGEPHFWATKGVAALWADYRGSGAYGNYADVHEGTEAANDANMRDVLAAVDTLAAQGIVDPDRVVLAGFSAGAYLTAWIIARAPNRFRAAIVQAGPTDLALLPALALWGCPSDEELARRTAASVMAHADAITTPTLLLYGERDDNNSIVHGYLLFNVLRARSVPCEMWKYLDEGHGLIKSEHQMHALQRKAAWVDRWVR